ncbi:MAG: prepilin-type N-terminal cleavage/methylation domain-containing protein [Alkalimonas sp.]|nr:prepilin-type N-terminal cleavage/methylation domain-containing protein [Alkalimonas sp.]
MQKNCGITLIELCIALVILALLAGIAYPSYVEVVLRSHRAEASETLLALAGRQELYFAEFRYYSSSLSSLGVTEAVTPSGRYQLSMDVASDGMSYQLVAVAVGAQAADTECQSFSLNHLGQRNEGLSYSDSCWL